MVVALDFLSYLDSFVLGWIGTDIVANLLLAQGSTFTKIRFFGTSFLTRRDAILLAYGQVIVAMIVSVGIADYIFGQIVTATAYLVPITLFTFAVFHIYILMGLPYKLTIGRLSLSLFLFGIAYLMHQQIGVDPSFAKWLASLFR